MSVVPRAPLRGMISATKTKNEKKNAALQDEVMPEGDSQQYPLGRRTEWWAQSVQEQSEEGASRATEETK